MTDQKFNVASVLSLNMCEEERTILDDAHFQGLDASDCYYELRQAAFEYYWDGETPEEEFKEGCWNESHDNYQSYLGCWDRHPLHMAAGRGLAEELDELIKSGADLDDMDEKFKNAVEFAANDAIRDRILLGRTEVLDARTTKIVDTWSPSPAEGVSLHELLNPPGHDVIERPTQRAKMRL